MPSLPLFQISNWEPYTRDKALGLCRHIDKTTDRTNPDTGVFQHLISLRFIAGQQRLEHSGNLFAPHLIAQATPIRLFAGYCIAVRISHREILFDEIQQLGCAGLLDGRSLASEELCQFSEIICLLGQILLFAATGQIRADDAHFHGREFLVHMGFSRTSWDAVFSSLGLKASLPAPQRGHFQSAGRSSHLPPTALS